MTLMALGQQYAEEAENLAALVAKCDERRRIAIRAGAGSEANRLKKLKVLHERQQQDLLQIADWLRHYYDDSGETQQHIERDWWSL
jgi:hypothetical protein